MKKVPIIHLIGLLMPVLLAAPFAFADVAADFKQAEEFYRAGQYDQAEQVYLTVINAADPNKPPEFEAALNARKKLPAVYLATGRLPQAQTAVQDLLAKHSSYEWLPHALHEVVEQARDLNKTAQAGQIYREILNAQPGHSHALWLKMGIALADVYLANGQAVDAGVKDIIARHSTDPWSAEALAQIGWAYDKVNEYAKARPLYEYVVDNWSDKPRVIHAHSALVRGCIRLRDKPAAQARLEQLSSRYATNPQLPRVLNEIARGYREAQMYQEARPLSQHILANYPGHEQCIWAQRDIVLCDIGERSQDAAQAGLQKLIKDHGENGYLPYVLNEIAVGYRQGRMYQQARSVSQYVLDNFADSDQCLWAQRDAVLSDLASGNTEAAAAGIQQLEGRFAKQSGVIWAISDAAEACARLGRHEQARDLFRFNVTTYPASDDLIWSMRGFVNESIVLKDEASTGAGIKKLFSEYSASKNLPIAVVHIGREFLWTNRSRASEMFQYVIDKHPDHEQALFAKVCLGHIHVLQGQNDQAEIIYQKVLADYKNNPRLPEAVCLMSEAYYERALAEWNSVRQKTDPPDGTSRGSTPPPEPAVQYLQRAMAKWAIVIEQLPRTPNATSTACLYTGICHSYLGADDKAIPLFEQAAYSHPEAPGADYAALTAARRLERLMRARGLSEDEADAATTPIYQQLVYGYPSSPCAKIAAHELEQIGRRSRVKGE